MKGSIERLNTQFYDKCCVEMKQVVGAGGDL